MMRCTKYSPNKAPETVFKTAMFNIYIRKCDYRFDNKIINSIDNVFIYIFAFIKIGSSICISISPCKVS